MDDSHHDRMSTVFNQESFLQLLSSFQPIVIIDISRDTRYFSNYDQHPRM